MIALSLQRIARAGVCRPGLWGSGLPPLRIARLRERQARSAGEGTAKRTVSSPDTFMQWKRELRANRGTLSGAARLPLPQAGEAYGVGRAMPRFRRAGVAARGPRP